MGWLKRIFKNLLDIKQDIPHDSINIGEQVIIHLVKDGRTIRTLYSSGHTWNSTGLEQIRLWLMTGSANRPNSFTTTAGGWAAANPLSQAGTIAIWLGTFASSGALSNISDIRLCYNATTYATVSVTTFTKPDGVSMEIRWESTISGV
jgi:hypothetical protein